MDVVHETAGAVQTSSQPDTTACEDQHQLRLTADLLPLSTRAGVSIGATVVSDINRLETPALAR